MKEKVTRLTADLQETDILLAEGRNAGGFLNGLPMLTAFPSEVLSEAWEKRAAIPGRIVQFFPSLVETVNIAAVATLLATRELSRWPRLTPVFRRLMDDFGAVPEIAPVLIFILGGGPVPAVIVIAIHTAGALGMFSAVAENADAGSVEDLHWVGANWSQRMWLGVIPQVAPNWLSCALLRFEINVRASAVLGFVGEGGIGLLLTQAIMTRKDWEEVARYMVLIVLVVILMDSLSGWVRRRLIRGG
ncbi:ABC transporter permease [Paracoccus sp. MC1862]|uniref:PhnE/PtxC family ABC transporter permease n=1 Tax=Paracoccus sp. MC1862 TaxID=2760307 RepID=UPI001F420F3B|nr:ABC transporter permease subunit [Paracoccus sp. MC1862]